jgi:hypothetical protein
MTAAADLPNTQVDTERHADLDLWAQHVISSSETQFGQGRREGFEATLRAAKTNATRTRAELDLGAELVNHLRGDEGIALLKSALARAQREHDTALSQRALEVLAEAELKGGELGNCVAQHRATSCIVPFAAEAVHRDPTGARAGAAHWLEILKQDPEDLRARWLLNLSSMAAGDFPAGVPETFRLPASVFGTAPGVGHFENAAPRLGFTRRNRAGGVVVEDFDNDGFLDIVLTSSSPLEAMAYYRNNGDGTFTDRSVESGLAYQMGALSCVQTDFDNDGLIDIFVPRGAWLGSDGEARSSLLRNIGGGRFEDVTLHAGLAINPGPTQAAVWADFDRDGFLDLFLGHEGTDEGFPPSQLFHNNHDGTFTDIAAKAGVLNERFAKGAVADDYNGDGWPDLFVSNQSAPNRLYRNNQDGTFTDVALEEGVTLPLDSFGSFFFDYDNDGWPDLYVASFPHPNNSTASAERYGSAVADVAADRLGKPTRADRAHLFHNVKGHFVDVSAAMGVSAVDMTMGLNFGDLDNDGWPDFYLGTGQPALDSLVPNRLFHNVGGQRFEDISASSGLGHLQKGHGIAFADFRNNGQQDVFTEIGGAWETDEFRNALFLNPGHDNHWLTVKLIGTKSNRPAVGARVKVDLGRRAVFATVNSGGSFGATSYQRSIGLGKAERIVSVEVRWPSGLVQSFEGVPLNAFVELTEGQPAYAIQARRAVTF